MKLEYGILLSPDPITLSVGTLKKPKLKEISEITFPKFTYYEFFLKLTPKIYFTELLKECGGTEHWDSMTSEEKEHIHLYDIILKDEKLCNAYIEILNFFFIESVIFKDGVFILQSDNADDDNREIPGIISKDNLIQVFEIIQQICCIYDDSKEEDISKLKFKNELAKTLYERMKKAEAEKKAVEQRKNRNNYSIPNIISAVSNIHPSINPINIWELTIFQLNDSFNRLQINLAYRIDCTRVSVWGNEDKSFNPALWYKNEYDTDLS